MSPKKKEHIETQDAPETVGFPLDISGSEKAKRKPKLYIPINDDGTLDTNPDRLRDKTVLDRARFALGMQAGGDVPAAPVEKPFEVPREAVPVLYDALAVLIRRACQMVKYPRALNAEQREVFLGCLGYSEEFKKQATEPTAKLIEKACGDSKLAAWAAKNQDAAMLVFLLSNETVAMFYRANVKAAEVWAAKQAEKPDNQKPNGETRNSEYRHQGFDEATVTQ